MHTRTRITSLSDKSGPVTIFPYLEYQPIYGIPLLVCFTFLRGLEIANRLKFLSLLIESATKLP